MRWRDLESFTDAGVHVTVARAEESKMAIEAGRGDNGAFNAKPGEKVAGEGCKRNEDLLTTEAERIVAGMTLGAVAFQMSLFYLVNAGDHDMRRYAYGVIGQTISIFCSVLTFSSMYAWIEEHVGSLSLVKEAIAFPSICVVFFIFMEIVVMVAARAPGWETSHPKVHGHELEVSSNALNAKAFGSCAAQMCGASALLGFGHLQFRAYEKLDSIPLALAIIPMAAMVFFLLMKVASWIRVFVVLREGEPSETAITWVEVAEECENEVFAFCMGFVVAVAARMIITDSLPYILLHGFQHAHHLEVANLPNILTLWVVGVLCGLVCILITVLKFASMVRKVDREHLQSKTCHRLIVLFSMTMGNSFAWCMCFGMHLVSVQLAMFREGIRLRLILAMFQSVLAYVIVRVLDIFVDMDCTGDAFDYAIMLIIDAMGTAVGIGWEQAFHECVRVMVEFMVEDTLVFRFSDDPKTLTSCLSIVIVFPVLLAYRLYIVPMKFELEEKHEREVETKKVRASMIGIDSAYTLVPQTVITPPRTVTPPG